MVLVKLLYATGVAYACLSGKNFKIIMPYKKQTRQFSYS